MRTPKAASKRCKTETPEQQVDAYIAAAPKPVQAMLRRLRQLIRAAAPAAAEKLSYGMPYYSFHGRLIYFAVFTGHVGVYLMGASKEAFAKEIKPYRTSKRTLRFPFGARLRVTLLKRIVKARMAESLSKVAPRGSRRSAKLAR